MVKIHYFKPTDNLQSYAEGYCYGLDNFSVSDVSVLAKNNDFPNYISFDGKGIDLNDVSKKFYQSEDYPGYVSSDVSDDSCLLNDTIRIQLSNSLELDLSQGVTFQFYGDCCREMHVSYRYEGYTAYEETLTLNSDFFVLKSNITCTSLEITFTKTTLPNQFIKLVYVRLGTVTVFSKLKDINLLEEINVLSEDLPINTLDFTVALSEEIDFQKNALMNIYSNNKYYGTFYLDEAERVSKNIYSVRASNCIKKLEETQFNYWDFMCAPLKHYLFGDSDNEGHSVSELSGVEITLNDDLSNLWLFGYVPAETCRYALCALAYASCYMIHSSRSDKIELKKIPQAVSSVITTNDKRIIGECTYKKNTPVSIVVFVYPQKELSEACEIKCDNKSNEWYEIIFPNAPTYIDESQILGNHTVETRSLTYMAFIAEEPNVTLKGQNYKIVKRNETFSNLNVINGAEARFDKFDIVKYIEGTGISIKEKKDNIEKYIQSGGTVTGKIRLRGEKVGDLIQIETAFDGIKTGIIKSMNVSFGYEDVADIEVLEWSL